MNVSAIIPTYNRRDHVCRAIDSVLAQTIQADEIIVVDDGSTDGTADAIHARYGSLVNLIQQENRGVSAARTRAVVEAQGEWVAFLDSDDVWHPTKLERQFEALEALGSEFGACFTNCSYMGNSAMDTTVFEEAGLKTNAEFGPLCNPIKYIVGQLGICVPSLLVLRSLVNEVGGFHEDLGMAEDRDLVFRLSFKTRFCFISTPLVSIDRTRSVQRLTRLLVRKDDRTYEWHELALRRMLACPELIDQETRQLIHDELMEFYYGWARDRISGLRFVVAFQCVKNIHRMGHSYGDIISKLISRAWRKVLRGFGE